ncbi:MAG: carboxymuconolactone decarboxylase family protein [Legionella sp.]|nr:carboxymuconolactone decarboxylase family protein [Legionella sp.]
MNIEQLRNSLPGYAKDIRLNLSAILTQAGAPDISDSQRQSIALSCAYATRNKILITVLLNTFMNTLSDKEIEAAQSAATIMSMNNMYYRFTHLMSDKSYSDMPAKLRMSVIGNPGVSKIDFELNCLAVSVLNGCGMCMESHVHELIESGVTKIGVQSAVRIAAVINAVALNTEFLINH